MRASEEVYDEFCADMLGIGLNQRQVDILAMRLGYCKGRKKHTRKEARLALDLTVGQLRHSDEGALMRLQYPTRVEAAKKWGIWGPNWEPCPAWKRRATNEEAPGKNKHEKKRQSQ